MKPFIAVIFIAAIIVVFCSIWKDSQNTEGIDRHLLEAVKGNKSLAKRLLEQARNKYPGKSDRWYVEKVIYDLERDRAGSRSRSRYYAPSSRQAWENIFLISAIISLANSIAFSLNRWFK